MRPKPILSHPPRVEYKRAPEKEVQLEASCDEIETGAETACREWVLSPGPGGVHFVATGAGVCTRAVKPALWAILILCAAVAAPGRAASLSDPDVDAYDVRVGTETFAGLYHFTTNTLLVETAEAITNLGSDTIKFYMGTNTSFQSGVTLGPGITNLLTLARDEPSYRQVLDMPFRHYIMWEYPLSNPEGPFSDGDYTPTEQANDYREMYDLTCYLLTNYNNSKKTFYLGHWEGDGSLDVNNWSANPSPAVVSSMIQWENNRQKAVDDAKNATTFSNVNVYYYAEANRVRDAMNNGTNNNVRMINAVIPYVTNLDCISYSSYDAEDLSAADLYATLNYMESHFPTNKASTVPGPRMWIGEYGWGADTFAQQEPLNRAYIQRLLGWNWNGRCLPFILFWEIYNNQTPSTGATNFCLIDPGANKVESYYLHQRFLNRARLLVAQFNETNGRLPSDTEFSSLTAPMLSQPLAAPVELSITDTGVLPLGPGGVTVSGTLAQGVYGDDGAAVWVFWGRQDGGTNCSNWDYGEWVGVNTNFNPVVFSASLTNLAANTGYYFRFYATNSSGEAWAPVAAPVNFTVTDGAAVPRDSSTVTVSGTVARAYGGDDAAVWVFWGRQDGGTTPAGWEQGLWVGTNTNFDPATYLVDLANLAANTGYYFRFYVTNSAGQFWAPDSTPFISPGLNPSDFGSRLKITFAGYNRSETLTNFPMLIDLSTNLPGFSYRQFASQTGADLRFTDSTGLVLVPHEIDEWNTNGVSAVWVSVPRLAGPTDAIWAYWGNPLATNPPSAASVWMPDYDLVWHLRESGFPYADSTQQHPALTGVAPVSTTGEIGHGGKFNGTTEYLNAGSINLGDEFTLSAWVNLSSSASNIQTIWANKQGGYNSDGFALYVNSYNTADGMVRLETGNGTNGALAATGAAAVSPNQWHRIAAVIDRAGANARLYVDGNDLTQSSDCQTDFGNQGTVNLGRFTNSYYYWKGAVDEARIESAARSADWLWATWMTVASNTALASYSPVTEQPPALALSRTEADLLLSWPASGLGFGLATATNIAPATSWSWVSTPAAFISNQWQITLPATNLGNRFFRLQPQ